MRNSIIISYSGIFLASLLILLPLYVFVPELLRIYQSITNIMGAEPPAVTLIFLKIYPYSPIIPLLLIFITAIVMRFMKSKSYLWPAILVITGTFFWQETVLFYTAYPIIKYSTLLHWDIEKHWLSHNMKCRFEWEQTMSNLNLYT